MRAVIFDLFGTLVHNLDPAKLTHAMKAMATALRVPPGEFGKAWGQTFHHRMDGRIQDGEQQFVDVLESIGLTATEEQHHEAMQIRRAFMMEALSPKAHALECLEELRDRGYRLGMATDCSSDTPDLLRQTTLGSFFEVIAASAQLRVTKPDPRMYSHVLEAIGVSGEECVYIGDGNSEELIGAKRHGMVTVWVDNGERQHWRERFVPEGDHTIRCLSEVRKLVRSVRGY